jgi:NAD-dependent SIR2 family protein deacetylase
VSLETGPAGNDDDRLEAFVTSNRQLLVITGAGCSTPSGIGAYRDESGTWLRAEPVQMRDFVSSEAARRRYWARSMHGWRAFRDAAPNAAHEALAALEKRGVVRGLITQNVDGLHQRAGHDNVIELHGSLRWVVCLECGLRLEREEVQHWLEARNGFVLEASASLAPDGDADLLIDDLSAFHVPRCGDCGGVLKPDVVFYGDSVPRDRVDDCYAGVAEADAVLVVGSSLMVFSSFRFVRRAVDLGKPVAAVNRGRTRADAWLEFKVDQDCAAALARVAANLEPGTRPGTRPGIQRGTQPGPC